MHLSHQCIQRPVLLFIKIRTLHEIVERYDLAALEEELDVVLNYLIALAKIVVRMRRLHRYLIVRQKLVQFCDGDLSLHKLTPVDVFVSQEDLDPNIVE